MFDRSDLINFCLLGIMAFMVLSSGIVQCVFNCIEDDALRSSTYVYEAHAGHLADCHPIFHEPVKAVGCPERSCHQNQAPSRSLGGPELTAHFESTESLLNGCRVPLPDYRAGEPFKQREFKQTLVTSSWMPPTTVSQTLLSVKTTVLLN